MAHGAEAGLQRQADLGEGHLFEAPAAGGAEAKNRTAEAKKRAGGKNRGMVREIDVYVTR